MAHDRDPNPPQEQSDPPRPHGDKLGEEPSKIRGDETPERPTIPRTGDMDRPEMNPEDEQP